MKKGKYILLGICAIFFVLTLGIFIGRSINNTLEIPAPVQRNEEVNIYFTSDDLLNLNAMTKEQLMMLPGIGETLAERIIDYRRANGPFQTIEDLMNVDGIGEKKVEQIIGLVGVGG